MLSHTVGTFDTVLQQCKWREKKQPNKEDTVKNGTEKKTHLSLSNCNNNSYFVLFSFFFYIRFVSVGCCRSQAAMRSYYFSNVVGFFNTRTTHENERKTVLFANTIFVLDACFTRSYFSSLFSSSFYLLLYAWDTVEFLLLWPTR